jgi:hypothetical protein
LERGNQMREGEAAAIGMEKTDASCELIAPADSND